MISHPVRRKDEGCMDGRNLGGGLVGVANCTFLAVARCMLQVASIFNVGKASFSNGDENFVSSRD